MNFDWYLESFDDEAGAKEHSALAVYYLEKVEGRNSVSQAGVRSLIQDSHSTFSPTGISRYFQRLKDDKWLASVGEVEYRLTPLGKKEVEERIDDVSLVDTREEDDRFIDTNTFEGDGRYEQLVADINECYRHRIYDATLVLTRKLFEDLVYQILQTHYGGDDVQMFYDQENSRHYTFDGLLTNLQDAVTDVRRHSRDLDTAMVEELRDLKDEGNEGAHSIRVDFDDGEVEEWSSTATRMAIVLHDVLVGVRNADGE